MTMQNFYFKSVFKSIIGFFRNIIFPKRYGDTIFLLFTILQRTFRKKKNSEW